MLRLIAATLLPLSLPSTHLISVTLDLIVLIDRLLTLLRYRGQLLELTGLRLQWDELRWQVMTDLRKLDSEVDELVRDRGTWRPDMCNAVASTTPKKQGIERSAEVSKNDELSKIGMSSVATPNHRKIERPGNPMQSKTSCSAAAIIPAGDKGGKTSSQISCGSGFDDSRPEQQLPASGRLPAKVGLHIALLHTHIVNLQIRHQNLASTVFARTGSLLDRIIDNATGLKDLGGTDGPSATTSTDARVSVIPSELLDVQERLEAELLSAGAKIAWCKQLEVQWER